MVDIFNGGVFIYNLVGRRVRQSADASVSLPHVCAIVLRFNFKSGCCVVENLVNLSGQCWSEMCFNVFWSVNIEIVLVPLVEQVLELRAAPLRHYACSCWSVVRSYSVISFWSATTLTTCRWWWSSSSHLFRTLVGLWLDTALNPVQSAKRVHRWNILLIIR